MPDLDFLPDLLRRAGRLALRSFRRVDPIRKADRSYVTEADLAVQDFLLHELDARLPDDGFVGEEEGLNKSPAAGARTWVLDPIDGTSSFVAGLPVWGVAVGLVEDGAAVAGFFYMPVLDELYHTPPQGRVLRNTQAMHLRAPEIPHPETVILTTTLAHRTQRIRPHYPGHVQCLGSAVAHLSYAASGIVDAALLEYVHVWDLAAGAAMLRRNGGVLRYLGGEEVALADWFSGERIERPMLGGHPDTLDAIEPFLMAETRS